jgi:hypothetical protein
MAVSIKMDQAENVYITPSINTSANNPQGFAHCSETTEGPQARRQAAEEGI